VPLVRGSPLFAAVGVAAVVAGLHGAAFAADRPDRARGWPTPVDAADDAWTRVDPFPVIGTIEGFWGPGADDVWAWSNWMMLHWDGRAWSIAEQPPEAGHVIAVGGVPGGISVELEIAVPELTLGCDVIAAHTRTSVWRQTADGWKAAGSSRDNLPPEATKPNAGRLEAGELGRLWSRYRGARTVPEGVVMATATRVGGGHVWAADDKGRWMSRFDGKRWASAMNPNLGTRAIWFASETDGWAVSSHAISRWDGTRWTLARDGFPGGSAVWGAAADDVWVAGGGVLLHWDGARWNEVPLPRPVYLGALWGSAANDIWAAPSYGGRGAAFHWDGAAWRQHDIPDLSVPRRRGLDAPLVIPEPGGRALVMTGQRVLSWNGRVWGETPGPLAGRLHPPRIDGAIVAVSSDGAGTTWAVGEQWIGDDARSVAFRRAAGVWTQSPLPPGTTGVKAVWARGASDVWVVGASGLILHWDGRVWNREASGTDDTLVAIHGAGRLVWVAGERGIFLRRRMS
jgi:hypothetical protein